MSTNTCGNCDAVVPLFGKLERSAEFVLEEHLCAACRSGNLSLRLVITRARPESPWGLESAQPLRTSFQVTNPVTAPERDTDAS